MDFILQHWKACAAVGAILAPFVAFAIGVTRSVPSSTQIAAWSIQEAIFYGCLVIAFAVFLK